MSSRNANTLGQTRERIIILLVALSVPLIVQFFLYILANAAGAADLQAHHIQPVPKVAFDPMVVHRVDNLQTLCERCHHSLSKV